MNVYEQTRGCKNHDLLIVKASAPCFSVGVLFRFYLSIILMDSIPTLPPRTTSICLNSSLISFDDCVIFGCRLDKFQKEAVFSVVDDTCLESLSNLEKFYFIFRGAALYLDVKDLLHANKHVCKINNLDHLDHTVQLFFDLLKSLIIADCGDGHSGNCGSSVVPTVRLSRL